MSILYLKKVIPISITLLALLSSFHLGASSFTVSPTRIPLSEKNRAMTVRLLNTGDIPVTVQAHVVAWSLHENQDVLIETDDLLLNPPIFKLDPQKPQLMRLGLRHPLALENEIAYRLIVEEVPPPPVHGVIAMRTILRISIPIFVEPRDGAKKQVAWKAEVVPGGIKITATNQGNTHVQFRSIGLSPEGGSNAPATKKVMDYLLPGKSHEWIFEEEQFRAAAKLSLTAVTDAGNFGASLIPENR